jgi:hypothetical protein
MIDLLLEKYLNTIEYEIIPGLPNQTEVFINPSRKERMEIFNMDMNTHNALRFIADMKKKNVYAFEAGTLHDEVWKQVGDGRKLYHDYSLLAGVFFKNGITKYESSFLYWNWEKITDQDWSWAKKYIPSIQSAIEDEKMWK